MRTVLKKEAITFPAELGKPFVPFFRPSEKEHPAASDSVRPLASKTLVNIINYLHFSDRSLFVHVERNGNGTGCLLPVHPEPCLDGEISCRWSVVEGGGGKWGEMIRNLIIDDGKDMIMVPAEVRQADQKSFRITLPDTSYVVARRESKRYRCNDVSAHIQGNGHLFCGELEDFCPGTFRVRLTVQDILRRPPVRSGDTVTVELKEKETVIFSGACICKRVESISTCWELVLSPAVDSVQVFQKRAVRNPRVQLKPPAIVSFRHPVLQTQVQMEVYDLCSSGFSVFEEGDGILLFPGMLIPDVTLRHSGSTVAHGPAQVVYRTTDENRVTRCGIAIMDMDLDGYGRINQLVENALDPCSQISGEIEFDSLWEFFFSTGFIYQKKYGSMHSAKQEFKDNCKILYQSGSEIAQHFVYQRNGRIYGHLSIIKAYERSWIIHHHAGRALNRRKSGLVVLRQVMHYFNDFSRMSSFGIEYAMCFFRPQNRFPDLFFGGLARQLKDNQICSMDLFSYLPLTKFFIASDFEGDWNLLEATLSDKQALECFYKEKSGGLLLDAMSISHDSGNYERLESIYAQHALLRKMKVYALKRGEQAFAFLIAEHSSRGLNFSELMNCIKVIIVREKELPWEVLRRAISQVSREYDMKRVPVMCYPSTYLEFEGIASEKSYLAWVFRLPFVDFFMDYMNQRFTLS